MKTVSREQVSERIAFENPWWTEPHSIDGEYRSMRRRAYFNLLYQLAKTRRPRRALILMGPRRVGKTVMIYQTVQQLIDDGVSPKNICYLNLETPLYNGIGLEELIDIARSATGTASSDEYYLFFDEILYLRQWEVHLKTVVDAFRNVKFVASGSAAAALRLKSTESGAGRFTDFMLPPVTFYEYLDLLQRDSLISVREIQREGRKSPARVFECQDIEALNLEFIDYLNYGGYPEAIFSADIQANPGRFLRNDVIDKVLLRDLPSLYGIHDIQELNSLFTTLAYNTAGEVSLESLAQNSGVAKNTIKRYIEYLESAFLIKMVHRVDHCGKKFSRANFFKVYLTNPCMRSALFSPLAEGDEGFGSLVETAVFAQWFHSSPLDLFYARWKNGEVDIVNLFGSLKPRWAVEVKWSDSFADNPSKLSSFRYFLGKHKRCSGKFTTKSKSGSVKLDHATVHFEPASLYCYKLGYNILTSKHVSDIDE